MAVERGRGRNDDTRPLLQYVARLDGGGEILGFGWGGYKESRPWCSLFVGFPSLFVAPSGEQLALLMCFSEQNVVVDVEEVGSRPRAVVVGREVMSGCTRISSQEYVNEK